MTNEEKSRLISSILIQSDHESRELFDSLSQHEKDEFIKIVNELKTTGDSPTFRNIWEIDWERRPPTIREFLEDEYYFGSISSSIYDFWKEQLADLFDPNKEYRELIISGSIGGGKTTIAVIAQDYMICRLLCLRNPQEYYGLIPGSIIRLGMFNVTLANVTDIEFDKVTSINSASPYFREMSRMVEDDPNLGRVLDLPKNIKFVFGSRAIHQLGRDIGGFIFDEVNFIQHSEIKTLYNTLKARIYSRYKLGLNIPPPGLMILISSRKDDQGYLDARIAEAKEDPHVKIVDEPIWVYRGMDKYSGKTFRVMVGDRHRASRILVEGEQPEPGCKVLDVPIEYYEPFSTNLEGSLRDIAGVGTLFGSPFIASREKIYECIDPTLTHPFKTEVVTADIEEDHQIVDSFIVESLFDVVDQWTHKYALRRHPMMPRFIHLDPALSGDAYGIACVHVAGVKEVTRVNAEGIAYVARDVIIETDFMLRVTKFRTRIDLSKARSFIQFLRTMGMNIAMVSADKFQSEDSLQILSKLGFTCKYYSVDRTPQPYTMLRGAVLEGRMRYYHYQPFLDEMLGLVAIAKGKADHKPGGSKDVADAVAGAASQAMLFASSHYESFERPLGSEAKEVENLSPSNRRSPEELGKGIFDDFVDIDHITGLL